MVYSYLSQEYDILDERSTTTVGSALYCMTEFKLYTLIKECKSACISKINEHTFSSTTHCKKCLIEYIIDYCTSSYVCTSCGFSKDMIFEQLNDYHDYERCNGPRRHYYDPTEHFSQTLSDFANIGKRQVPYYVLEYCRKRLGTGLHVSSILVFQTLQNARYTSYYQYKYEIANQLRGKQEFTFSSKEIIRLRDLYNRYRRNIYSFQEEHSIGKRSKNGKLRIYWPMRFILYRLCQEVHRYDVLPFIRTICSVKKTILYDYYWDLLTTEVNSKLKPIYKRIIQR